MVKRRFFGTDGIRGRMGEEPITPERILKLGWAAGRVLGAGTGDHAKVLIGKDTRVSGYLLESALEAGLSAAGVDIYLLGPMPTPGIAYLTRTARARAGIVISASHNPFDDNGIKFFGPDGMKLADEVEEAIEAAMDEPLRTVAPRALGKARRYEDAAGRYIEFCKSTFPHRLHLEGLKIVLDCAHGAAYHVAPHVFSELGAEVVTVAAEPDGFNINHECGSTHPALLQRTVRETGADLGIALDGDGDRVIMADRHGELVDGDQILYIAATARAAEDRLRGGGVVGTVMSNLGLELALKARGIEFRRAAVGDRHVLAVMQALGWEVGGETSGHVLLLDKSTTGDGIVSALEVLAVMVRRGKPLHELASDMTRFPQTLVNVRMPHRFDLQGSRAVEQARRAAEEALAGRGRVVLRASGTEPVVRVMVEGEDPALVERLARELADVLRQTAEAAA